MNEVKTSWKIRRVLMIIVTTFCMAIIWLVVHGGMDTETARTAMKYSFWVIFSVLVIYVFGVISDEQIARLIDKKFNIGEDK